MSCSEFEKRIYLYQELTSAERNITDEHVARCESCRAMASLLLQRQEIIRKAKSIKPVIHDPEWLTQRIMNSIERKEKPVSQLDGIKSFLDNLFVRYAFSAISVLLIAFFFIEHQAVNRAQIVANAEIKQGTILKTSNFLKAHLKSRQNREKTISVSRYSYHKSERVIKTL
jgi:predicted anti-sigma-YlaC factor YlaD